MDQYKKGKTTSLKMEYNPATTVLSFSHDGFVPYNATNAYTPVPNTDQNNYYRTTLTWTPASGATVSVTRGGATTNYTNGAAGIRVYKTDTIKLVSYSGATPLTFTLTDDQRYLKAGSIRGDNYEHVNGASNPVKYDDLYQYALIGYAEFVTLRNDLTCNPINDATKNSDFSNTFTAQNTQVKLKKTVSAAAGFTAPTTWGDFNFGVHKSTSSGSQGDLVGIIKPANQGATDLTFDIPLNTVGLNYFLVKEVSTNSGAWKVSTLQYLFVVDVGTSGNSLTVGTRQVYWRDTAVSATWNGQYTYTDSYMTFDNKYSPTPTTTTFTALKQVRGTYQPSSWSFNFAVFESDVNGTEYGQLGATKSASAGIPGITFDPVPVGSTGPLYFLIRETTLDGGGWNEAMIALYCRETSERHSCTSLRSQPSNLRRKVRSRMYASISRMPAMFSSCGFNSLFHLIKITSFKRGD